jgi:hypothetical protein
MSSLKDLEIGKSYTHPEMKRGVLKQISLRILVFKLPFSTRKYTFDTKAYRDEFISQMKEVKS